MPHQVPWILIVVS